MEDDKKKKTFSENAKGFLGAWKDDFAKKNKDVLDRAKERKEAHKELNQKIVNLWKEIKVEFGGTAKDIYDTLQKEMNALLEAAKEGNATVAQKLQVEKRMEQMTTFLESTEDRGKEEFDKIAQSIKEKFSGVDFVPDIDNVASEMKNMADESLANDNLEKLDDLKKDADDINDFFEKKD